MSLGRVGSGVRRKATRRRRGLGLDRAEQTDHAPRREPSKHTHVSDLVARSLIGICIVQTDGPPMDGWTER